MADWITDTARLSYAAARLASFPGTEHHLAQLAHFADYLESEATLHHNYFYGVAMRAQAQTMTAVQPQEVTLRHGAPMRPQSMSRTPPEIPELPGSAVCSEGSSPMAAVSDDEMNALFAPYPDA